MGAANVDEFLETIDPKLFKRWRAFFKVERAEQWEQASFIAAAAWNAAVLISGLPDDAREKLHREWRESVPWEHAIRKPKRRKQKAKQTKPDEDPLLSTLAARYGPKP